jgi:hypothetical protein
MALVLANRVQEQATANTTVSFTLTGATLGFQTFAVVGDGNTTFYSATDAAGNWEVGLGTYSTTGPTLTRTTVYASSNSGSAVTFSGTVTVFVTYPSGKSVNLDASGNVSALGTVSSGTWQGSTVGVAYGGTGVTASSGANSVVLRDANQNINVNSITQARAIVTSAGGTTVLTAASAHFQILIGTSTQTFQLPDATLLPLGSSWIFDNDSTGNLTITDYAGGAVDVVAPGGYSTVFLEIDGTVAGTWGKFGMIPSEVNWGTNSLDLGGSTVITNGVWNGTPVASGYGGTGLTGFVGANNALYSTGASTLTAGTLPLAAGGTGLTSYTAGDLTYYASGSAFTKLGIGTSGQILTSTGTAPQWSTLSGVAVTTFSAGTTGFTPSSATSGAITLSGTLKTSNGGTGLSSYTAGDLIYYSTGTALSKLGIGTANRVLTSSGTAPQWSTSLDMAGSVTATALIPSGSSTPTNGMYLSTTNTVTLATNSSDRLTIDSTGNVGIGTTYPSATLELLASEPKIRFSVSGPPPDFSVYANVSGGYGYLYTKCETTGAVSMAFSEYGNALLGGTNVRTATVGSAHLDLFDGTAPAGNLTNGISLYSSSGDFNFMDSAGNGYKVGFRNLPPVGTKTGSYTLAVGDVGKYVQVSTGGSITIPTSTFAEGDAITIANNTTGSITITCSAPTAYISGTNTVKTSMTLATRGVATVLFLSSTVCFVSGNVT